jgi:chemotaxis protein MotA
MGKGTIIGLIVGFGALLMGFTMEKGNIGSLLLTSPIVIVLGGTIGALMISFSIKDVVAIPKLIKEAMSEPPVNLQKTLDEVVELASTVKKQGLLSLEKVIKDPEFQKTHDPLLARGLSLLIDGLDKNLFKDVLESELYFFDQKKKGEIAVFEAAGGFSPTMGIIGTVLGLIQVLSNMGSPEELAAAIAVAFIATLYGVCFANLIYLPIANKLKLRLKIMSVEKQMIIEGILSINDCESPIVIKEKLRPFVELQGTKPSKKPEAPDATTYNTVKEETEA